MKRLFLRVCLISVISIVLSSVGFPALAADASKTNMRPLLPPALHKGDTVGLISSGFRAPEDRVVEYAVERLHALGLKVKVGQSVFKRYGYFAGNDAARASDINHMFADKNIKGIFEVRGGWGSARTLEKINYKLIKTHPKIIIGFSDITALLLAINAKTGLVTFHGPVAGMPWTGYTADYLKRVLFRGEAVTYKNIKSIDHDRDIIQTENRVHVIHGGRAEGRLLGGNLTVLTSLIGSGYLPNFKGAVLFVEEVEEDFYRIDRMMNQLKEAGILKQLSGFVFGRCTRCSVGAGSSRYGTRTLAQILDHYIKPLGIPAWSGAMIGHHAVMFVLPEGVNVAVDADKAQIRMLTPAVRRGWY